MPSVVIYGGCKFRLSSLLFNLCQAGNEEESSKHRWGVLCEGGGGHVNMRKMNLLVSASNNLKTSCNLTYGLLCY
jgi:hypothetical protein